MNDAARLPTLSQAGSLLLTPKAAQRPQRANATSGRTGTSTAHHGPSTSAGGCWAAISTAGSALQLLPFLGVEGLAPAEEEDDEGQGHGRLGRGDGEDEDHEGLAGVIQVVAAERDQGDARGLEHQLGAEEHDDQVAAGGEADQADGEHEGGDEEVVAEGQPVDGLRVVALGEQVE